MLLQDTASADPLTSYASFPSFPHSQPLLHQRPDLLPAQHPQQHARLAHVEDAQRQVAVAGQGEGGGVHHVEVAGDDLVVAQRVEALGVGVLLRSEEHTSELQSLMRISYAVFCLKKQTNIMLKHQRETA